MEPERQLTDWGRSERVEGKYPFAVDSVLALPLEGDHGPMGAIGLFSKHGQRRFTAEDTALVRLVSANLNFISCLPRGDVRLKPYPGFAPGSMVWSLRSS